MPEQLSRAEVSPRDRRDIERFYGEPCHEPACRIDEREFYGEPQHEPSVDRGAARREPAEAPIEPGFGRRFTPFVIPGDERPRWVRPTGRS